MKTPDFNEKNMEYLATQMVGETENMIYLAIQMTQGLMNTKDNLSPEDAWFKPGDLNTIEFIFRMTQSPAAQFTNDEYIQFLNKYNLRDYLDISKL